MSENKYTRLAKDTAVFAAGNLLTKLIYFLMVPLYTSALSTAQYARAEMLNTLIDIVYPIATMYVVEAMYRFTIDDDADLQQTYGITMRITLWSILFVTVGSAVLYAVFQNPETLLFGALYISFSIYKAVLQFARALGRNVPFAIAGVINALMLTGMNVLLLLVLKGGVASYICSIIVANVTASVYIFFATGQRKYISLRFRPDKALRRVMLRYSIPCVPNMLGWWVVNVSDRYMLQYMVSDAVCGVYTAASKLPAVLSTFSTIFQQAWQYSAVKESKSEDSETFYSEIFTALSTFLLCLSSVVTLCTDVLCRIVLQKEFYEGRFILPILLAAAVYSCYAAYFGTFYGVIKNNVMVMVSTILAAVVNVVLNLLLIPRMGALGAAYATLISYAVMALIRIVDTRKYVRHHVRLWNILAQNVLLVAEAVVMTGSGSYRYPAAGVLTAAILALNGKTIVVIWKRLLGKFREYRGRKK